MSITGERNVAITGIGQTEPARPSNRSALDLTVEACLEAIADAGLERDDIDGLATYPGFREGSGGYSPVGFYDVRASLGLKFNWFSEITVGAAQASAFFAAIGALLAGLARHVLVFRVMNEATARASSRHATLHGFGNASLMGAGQWVMPYGAYSGATLIAPYAARHFHDYGTRPEHLGQIALTCRRHAGLNPRAIYRTPITMDDYLASRTISTPLRLFDCDAPIDGATAFVLSRADEARDMPNPVIRFEAIGSAVHRRDTWYLADDYSETAAVDSARMMWSRTDLKPSNVDLAQLYDGFSICTLYWLEAMGFCGRGESGPFVGGGARIGLDGQLPLNTGGGQLSAGRFHGFGHVHEACTQLWGRGGARQVEGAPSVCAVGLGFAAFVGSMLLVRD